MPHEPSASDADLRPTHVDIDLTAITDNLAAIQRHVAPATVMAIVKANAYGHGLVDVARHLVTLGVEEIGVAYIEEAEALREAGVDVDILVMGGLPTDQVARHLVADAILTASSPEMIDAIDAVADALGRRARAHLKIDTGMGRVGMPHREAERLFEAAAGATSVDVEGVYSHFACADEVDLTSARTQLRRFDDAMKWFPRHDRPMPRRHMANSGGILQLPEARFDTVRAGIMLYGVYPSDETPRTVPLRPALTWRTSAVFSKVVEPGDAVSYGSTWTADRATRIVTLPVGYGDGYSRLLSNRGEVLIGGRRRPIRGRVCMDQLLVDVGEDPVEPGASVVLLGSQDTASIDAAEIARWSNTIAYETLTAIGARVPRRYAGRTENP